MEIFNSLGCKHLDAQLLQQGEVEWNFLTQQSQFQAFQIARQVFQLQFDTIDSQKVEIFRQ